MRPHLPPFLLALLCAAGAACAGAQELPAVDDTRQSMLRETMLSLVPAAASVPDTLARQHCIALPADPRSNPIQAPHGDVLLGAQCSLLAYHSFGSVQGMTWISANYQWSLAFKAEDATGGAGGREIVTEEEVVLFEASDPGQVRPYWHARFETGDYAAWRSVTPEIAPSDQGTILLSVMWCFNGTGGCGQEFLRRHRDGRWFPVLQDWLDQLPSGFGKRIWKGIRIDPATLQGEAGLYNDGAPNCCPSQRLLVRLALRGDALVLLDQAVTPWQQ